MKRFLLNLLARFKEYFVLSILLIFSLLLLSINQKPEVKKLRIFAFANFAFLNSTLDGISTLFSNQSRIEELQKLNAELNLEVNFLREHAIENKELREMLNFQDSLSIPLLPAQVISKLVSNIQGNFIINRGAHDGVKTGMSLINERGLIGIITNVSSNFSLARHLQNNHLKITAEVQRTGVTGILNWNGSKLVFRNIPTSKDVKIGDRIITSDFSTIFPPTIPIGVVTGKETTISGLLSNVYVKPYVDLTGIKNLFVLKIDANPQIDSLKNILVN